MPISTRRLVDQLAATPEERELHGEFLFEGAGEILETLRKKMAMSLAEAAKRLDIAPSTVLRYEKNEVPLSDYAVARFSEIYNADAETVMLECMKKVLPGMLDSPFGKILERFLPSNPLNG